MLTHAKCENEGLKHWSCMCHTGYPATVTMEIIKCFHDNQNWQNSRQIARQGKASRKKDDGSLSSSNM